MDADILIVDDEVDILHFMQRALTRAGYRVRTAASGALGLVAIADYTPVVVLLDWGLPDMRGELMLTQLHTHYSTIPIIVITGDPRPVQALGCSIVKHILMKPFELRELLSVVAPYSAARRNS